MTDKGKRLIFCDECTLPAQEGAALDAGILPGSLVKFGATGINQSTDAAIVFGSPLLVADYDMLAAGTTDDAWTQNENMISRQVESGKRANVLVAAGNNITALNVGLSSNGDGTLKIAATDGTEQVLCTSDEIINVAGAAALVRVRGI